MALPQFSLSEKDIPKGIIMNLTKIKMGLLEFCSAAGAVLLVAVVLIQLASITGPTQQIVGADIQGRYKETWQLTPYKARKSGPELTELPRDLEDKKSDFSKLYGRKLLKERQNRYISQWSSKESALTWQVKLLQAGEYLCEVFYKSKSSAQERARLIVDNKAWPLDLKKNGSSSWSKAQLPLTFSSAGIKKISFELPDLKGSVDFQKIQFKRIKTNNTHQQSAKK